MYTQPTDIHLVLFLSRATPLSRWQKIGILEREIAIYNQLALRLGKVSIVTSAGAEDLEFQKHLGNISILYNRWRLPPNMYSLLAPFLHWSALRKASVFKTNQLDGSWTAIVAGVFHRKKVIVRAGYLWAETNRQEGGGGQKAALMDQLQTLSFQKSDKILLTTNALKQQVVDLYNIPPEKIKVIPNYVDTDKFRPLPDIEPVKNQVCYVGRLHPRKNLSSLIEAISGIPEVSLILIGQGEQRKDLEKQVQHSKANVHFRGVLPHTQLATEINRCEIFILPSLFEGHPKSLIEAMACGVAVIGTDVEGISTVIKHNKTGLLCPLTVEGIRDAIHRLLEDKALRLRLGNEARAYVEQEISLTKIIEQELILLQQVQNEK